MTRTTFLTWFPRILAILFAGFITIFALDSFEGHDSWIQKLGHLLVHLLPTAAVIGLLCLAWRKRIIGGLAFMVLGMIFTIHFGTWRETHLFLLFSMPLFVTGVGFIFSRYAELNAGKN